MRGGTLREVVSTSNWGDYEASSHTVVERGWDAAQAALRLLWAAESGSPATRCWWAFSMAQRVVEVHWWARSRRSGKRSQGADIELLFELALVV